MLERLRDNSMLPLTFTPSYEQTCGVLYRGFITVVLSKRVAGNAFPSGVCPTSLLRISTGISAWLRFNRIVGIVSSVDIAQRAAGIQNVRFWTRMTVSRTLVLFITQHVPNAGSKSCQPNRAKHAHTPLVFLILGVLSCSDILGISRRRKK